MNGRPVTVMGVIRVIGWCLLCALAALLLIGYIANYHAPPNQECSVPAPGDC